MKDKGVRIPGVGSRQVAASSMAMRLQKYTERVEEIVQVVWAENREESHGNEGKKESSQGIRPGGEST